MVRVDAVHFTPQSRARVFVIAEQDAERSEPFHAVASETRPAALAQFMNAHSELHWSLRDWPKLPKRTDCLDDILDDLPEDDSLWWDEKRTRYLLGQLSPKHEKLAEEMIAGNSFRYATAFRRVPQGAIDGGAASGWRGGMPPHAARGEWAADSLSRRQRNGASQAAERAECARLQGAPEGFQIDVPLNQALFGFGDAVCVPVVEWVLEHGVWPRLRGEAAAKKPNRLLPLA